jgi:hypothetical protein
MLTTSVAFILFNRPDLTQIVFNAIRQAQPQRLLVIADGPRTSSEKLKCLEARGIINQVDWKCEVSTNFSDENLGCRNRISSGLDWVFDQVEEAIILEDDCLPAPSFFPFCQTLLDRFRYDKRIMAISGNNFQNGILRTPYSYYFSKYNHCWGWATWRRSWEHWNFSATPWMEFKNAGLVDQLSEDPYEIAYWRKIFDNLFLEGKPDTWDYAWTFKCWSQGGLTILPNTNMVTNIGFREDGTHTTQTNPLTANLPSHDIWEISHPPFVIRHKQADLYTFDHNFGGLRMKRKKNLFTRLLWALAQRKTSS